MDKAKFGLHLNLQAFGTDKNTLKSAFTYMYGIMICFMNTLRNAFTMA